MNSHDQEYDQFDANTIGFYAIKGNSVKDFIQDSKAISIAHFLRISNLLIPITLDVKELKKKGHNKRIHRNIHDASWSKFVFMLSSKAESANRKLIKVDPGTQPKGVLVVEALYGKNCPIEYMSALIVESHVIEIPMLLETHSSQGWNSPLRPIESKPLHHVSFMQVLELKWEAVPFRAAVHSRW